MEENATNHTNASINALEIFILRLIIVSFSKKPDLDSRKYNKSIKGIWQPLKRNLLQGEEGEDEVPPVGGA